jgi:uncharacterized protein (TIGR02757 family)
VLEDWFCLADIHGGPRAFVLGFDASDPSHHKTSPGALDRLSYRWLNTRDATWFLAGLRDFLERHGSFEDVFKQAYDPTQLSLRDALSHTCQTLDRSLSRVAPLFSERAVHCRSEFPDSLARFVSDPTKGSSCKRWNLAMRWLVRPADGVDLGLWTWARPDQLVIPLDVHVGRISRFLGLTHRKAGNWSVAEEVTENLRQIDPADPVRFDFYLAHLGISGKCPGHRGTPACAGCRLATVCKAPKASAKAASSA